MTYTKKQFIEDVKKEARALKKTATVEEIDSLDFQHFNPESPSGCIYGQMTGNCRSKRASELIFNCCKRYVDMPPDDHAYALPTNFDEMKECINGEKIPGVKSAHDLYEKRDDTIWHFSSIEAYIMMPDAKSANLIDYLKGTRNDLVL
jgi:hypothetical protein